MMRLCKTRRLQVAAIVVLLIIICIFCALDNNTKIEDEDIPLAGPAKAYFYLNNTSISSKNASYIICKKIGTGKICTSSSNKYSEDGLDNYIVEEPDVSKFVKDGQEIRWQRIYKSFSKYYVIGKIYDLPKDEAVDSGFAHTSGQDIYIGNEKYVINGVVASNAVASSPKQADSNMMSEEDYQEIKELGLNTVRFLFNYDILEDDSNPYVYKESGWKWFDENIEWAKKYGIHIILDCHLSQGGVPETGANQNIWEADNENRKRLIEMWKAIAERYSDNETILSYGILNEPYIENGDYMAWNELVSDIIDGIRQNDNNHILFIQRATIGENREYIYPNVKDTNWVLEVHKYPNVEMKLVDRYFDEVPSEFLYYGNEDIVAYRDNDSSTEVDKPSISVKSSDGISSEWSSHSFEFTGADANNAYVLIEISDLKQNNDIEIKDLSIKCDGKEIYNLTNNIDDTYRYWSKSDKCVLDYKADNDFIGISGPTQYVSVSDNSNFRYVSIEPGKKYTVSFMTKTDNGIDKSTSLKVSVKEYSTDTIYHLDKSYVEHIMDCSDIQTKYNVPVFYGEVGIPRNVYQTERNIDEMSYDILEWLKDNSCNFTWFTWHEPNYGLYTASGLDIKSNPNEELLNQIDELYGNN